MFVASLVAVAVLVLVHLFADRLKFLDGTPRSRWLSAAGGISLAYVFLHLMPELAEGQAILVEEGLGIGLLEFEIYGLALIGLLAFYGIERLVQVEQDDEREEVGAHPEDMASRPAQGSDRDGMHRAERHPSFWLHLTTFGIYNLIIGYLLLHRGSGGHGVAEAEEALEASRGHAGEAAGALAEAGDPMALFTFAIAMALHFLVTDYGLREDFRGGWMRTGRWLLSGAVILGWVFGVFVQLPEIVVLGAIALLGGGVILNVLKEELPEERQSRFSALVLGSVGYAALLVFAH